ncbi:MAG: hypothetical protein ACLQBJ_06125 [Bryobacteraceae bacterium]
MPVSLALRTAAPGKIEMEATNVNTIRDIERAIDTLPPEELDQLLDWLDRRHAQRIDARLASDLEAGRMDEAIRRALDRDQSGEARPL